MGKGGEEDARIMLAGQEEDGASEAVRVLSTIARSRCCASAEDLPERARSGRVDPWYLCLHGYPKLSPPRGTDSYSLLERLESPGAGFTTISNFDKKAVLL